MERQSSVFGKLRSRNTYDTIPNEDEWFIPYNAGQRPNLPTRQSGIGLSPITQKSISNNIFSNVFSNSNSNPNNNGNAPIAGPSNSQPFPRPTPTPMNTYSSTYGGGLKLLPLPRRPTGTLAKSPSYGSLSDLDMTRTERLPSSSSVPTGLAAPSMLFSPLNRELRASMNDNEAHSQIHPQAQSTQRQIPSHPIHRSQPLLSQSQRRQRAVSAPRPSKNRNPHMYRAESRRWAVPTMCDMFLLPRPTLLPHEITPPVTPEEEQEKRLSMESGSYVDHEKVLENSKAREQEREEWANMIKRRGRSLSLGSTAPPPGAPIIGNVRARSKERSSRSRSNSLVNILTPSSSIRKRSASFTSRWSNSRKSSMTRNESERGNKSSFSYPNGGERQKTGVPKGYGFVPPAVSSKDYGTFPQQRFSVPTENDPFYRPQPARKRSTSMPFTNDMPSYQNDPLLANFATTESRYPTSAIPSGRTLQFKQPSVADRVDRGGVVIITKGASRSTPSRGSRLEGTFKPPAPLNLSKPLPDIPKDDISPILPESGPFIPFTEEIGLAISSNDEHEPKGKEQISEGEAKAEQVSPKTAPLPNTEALSPRTPTKSRLSDGGSATARAFLAKQQQRARTKRAFQSPVQGPTSYQPLRDSTVPSSASTSTSISSALSPTASSTSIRSDGPRRKTALEEAIGRSRAASVGALEQQQQKFSPTRAVLLDRPNTGDHVRAAAKFGSTAGSRGSVPIPPKSSINSPESVMKQRLSSPPLDYPISTMPSPRTASRAAFLEVQRPIVNHQDSARSKMTVYTDASEGWSRVGGDSARTTPISERKGRLSETPSEGSPHQTPDDREFQGLFFRTPADRNGSFSNTPIPDRYAPSSNHPALPRFLPRSMTPIGLGYDLNSSRDGQIIEEDQRRRPSEGSDSTAEITTPNMTGNSQVQQPYMGYLDQMASSSGETRIQQRLMAPWVNRPITPESINSGSGSDLDERDEMSHETHETMMPILSEGREFPFPQSQNTIRNLTEAQAQARQENIATVSDTATATNDTEITPDGKRRLSNSRPHAPLSPGTFGITPNNSALSSSPTASPTRQRNLAPSSFRNYSLSAHPPNTYSLGLSPHRYTGEGAELSPIPGQEHRHSAAVSFFDEFPSPPTAEHPSTMTSLNNLPDPKVSHKSAFGQLVTGPPGAGKSTYCHGLHQFFTAIERPIHIINLDPAVTNPPYPCDISITELIDLDSVMEEFGLGPNGAMLYCVEYLEQNLDWLIKRLDEVLENDNGNGYVVFDTPGQVELWTNHDSLKNVLEKLGKLDYRLAAVHLSDAHYITDASKFISVVLLALRAMLQLEMPHVNVLSKIDLLSTYGELPFDLSYYTEVQDLSYLLARLDSEPRAAKFGKLNKAMVELVDDFGLVGFETLAVEDKSSMLNLVRLVDKMTGYIFIPHGEGEDEGANSINTQALFGSIMSSSGGTKGNDVRDVQERWLDNKDAYDEFEREEWAKEWEERKRTSANDEQQQPQHSQQ
ncbi:uncharacterized protein IL334_004046 [Kwoniella shivajii]|uniref:Cytoplasmic protein n=1 Tax=Kwoniella shivajii TaxID=564305 RepID=A0ABZ1CZM6_9TREE|nr:hypothetical protein IL334_004046 [Kwoniella shivajii]